MNRTTWHESMLADLLVAGMSNRTQEAYLRAVRQLQDYYNGTDPKQLSEQQVKGYLLWLRTEKRAAPGTLRIAIGGLRFFFRHTAVRDWKVLDKFRIPTEKKLPEVLTVLEVRSISYRCAPCAAVGKPSLHFTNASCGNRHCLGCQTSANGEWCVDQTKKLLPCEYSFITFTVPEQLRNFIRSNQSLCYDAMFKAAAVALRTTMAEPKHCGATQPGFTSVLHTFGGDLVYHPHIHVLMPSGGLNDDGEWKSLPPGFVLPVKLLSIRFRMEFERLVGAEAQKCGLTTSVGDETLIASQSPSATVWRL